MLEIRMLQNGEVKYNELLNKGFMKSIKHDYALGYDVIKNGKKLHDRIYRLENQNYYINEVYQEEILIQLAREKYNAHNESPFSRSYYSNPNKDWNGDIDGGIRISDHWNFTTSDGKVHCETVENVEHGWYVGRYDAQIRKYRLIEKI